MASYTPHNAGMAGFGPGAVLVRLDDPELQRWIGALSDQQLATELRAVLARASHVLVVLELVSLQEAEALADAGATLTRIHAELRQVVQPVREASDALAQAFTSIGHIDVERDEQLDPSDYAGSTPLTTRRRVAQALSAPRRLIAREWRTLKRRLADDRVRSSPPVLITFCRAHLDRVETLTEYIAPALFGVLAPEGVEAQAAEREAAVAIRAQVVDFHRTCREVERALELHAPGAWPPYLQAAVESLDRLLYGIAFSWLRDSDQRMLTDCRELLDQALELWTPLRAAPMQRLVATLVRVGSSLLRINDRPSVRAHDLQTLDALVALLGDDSVGNEDERGRTVRAKAVVALHSLYGRDAGLDTLASAGLAVGGTLDLDAVSSRARRVLKDLRSP